MPVTRVPSDHPRFPDRRKTGLLLVNLSTPDGTDTKSMRRYLKQFLSDRRVVSTTHSMVDHTQRHYFNIRPRKSGDAYAHLAER